MGHCGLLPAATWEQAERPDASASARDAPRTQAAPAVRPLRRCPHAQGSLLLGLRPQLPGLRPRGQQSGRARTGWGVAEVGGHSPKGFMVGAQTLAQACPLLCPQALRRSLRPRRSLASDAHAEP